MYIPVQYCTSPSVTGHSGDYSRLWVCAQLYWELGLSRRLQVCVCVCFQSLQLWPRIRHVFIPAYFFIHLMYPLHTDKCTHRHTLSGCFLLKMTSRFMSFSVYCMNKCSVCEGARRLVLVFHLSPTQGQGVRDTRGWQRWMGEVGERRKEERKVKQAHL